MTSPPPDAVIVHLSDLHFSGYLQNVDNIGEWSRVAKTHNFLIVQQMESVLRRILDDWHEKAIVVVSGDLTTAAEPPAYETVATYLFGKVWVSRNKSVGLALQSQYGMGNRLFVVPGNHDAWLRLAGFWRVLTRWRNHYDRRALFRQFFGNGPRLQAVVLGPVSFIVLLLDSNEVLATFSNGLNLRNVLGRGRVGSDQIGQVITEYQEFLRNPALHPAGFDSTTAIRLAVMHHHPAIPVQQPQDFEQELLRLQDAEEVTQLFRYELQTHLVLCGHQHFPYLYPDPNDGRPWLTCAGTATQSESEINSFKLYWVYQTSPPARLEVEEYRRERSSPTGKFQPQPRISVPLGQ